MTMTGQTLKTNGQNSALRSAGSAWLHHALAELRHWLNESYLAGRRVVTMDEFRQTQRCTEPYSPNAWGSLPRSAVRAGLLIPSHTDAKAKRLAAHARRVRLWCICPDALDPIPERP